MLLMSRRKNNRGVAAGAGSTKLEVSLYELNRIAQGMKSYRHRGKTMTLERREAKDKTRREKTGRKTLWEMTKAKLDA